MNGQFFKLVNEYIIHGIIILVGVLVMVIVKPVLAPCCTAAVMAYLLNPLVDKLQRFKLSRRLSVSIILLSSLFIIVAFLVSFIPTAYSQLLSLVKFLIEKIPLIHKDSITSLLQKYSIVDYEEMLNTVKLPQSSFESLLHYENIKPLIGILGSLLKNLDDILFGAINSSISISYTISIILVTPLLLFYILCNWPSIIECTNALIPIKYQSAAKLYAERIDHVISAYIRGQLSVCFIMATYYIMCFSLIKLKYFLIIGFISGIMTFVPYVGPVFCAMLSLITTMLQFNSWTICGIVLTIFVVGQLVESNIITPLLIGKQVDIHPIWIIIGMITCGSQIGFTGILLSIPITAIVGVFVRAFITHYMNSKFYNDT
ncbi:AI-2E family transporter [Ehrlichia japonica]|nr:AI-2E family transporter [Ehrlichia japonica]